MICDDTNEMQRIAERNKKIEAILAEGDSSKPAAAAAAPAPVQPKLSPPLQPWERVRNGKREQWRRLTAAEIDAEQERAFLKSQWDQDQIHAAAVKAAEKEQAKEIAENKKRADHTKQTGRREYGKERFISLEEARRRGYLQSSSSDDSGNNWSSPGNESGLFASGRGR